MAAGIPLADLDPDWVRIDDRPGTNNLANAQGVRFVCPQCSAVEDGERIGHLVVCWFRDRGVPKPNTPGPGRWAVSGTGFADLTLQPSVHIKQDCGWHGFVTNGMVT